jgi:hypothetical protein
MLDERTRYALLILVEYDHDPGRYCSMLSDDHMLELGTLLHEAFHDPGVLGPLVKDAPWEYD